MPSEKKVDQRPDKFICMWAFQNIYHLRFNGIARSKWRRRMAEESVRRKIMSADTFVSLWAWLEKEGYV